MLGNYKFILFSFSSNAASIIARYAKMCQVFKPEQILFTNYRKEPLTRSGVAYILRKYVEKTKQKEPALFGNTDIHPHVLRHSKAMHRKRKILLRYS